MTNGQKPTELFSRNGDGLLAQSIAVNYGTITYSFKHTHAHGNHLTSIIMDNRTLHLKTAEEYKDGTMTMGTFQHFHFNEDGSACTQEWESYNTRLGKWVSGQPASNPSTIQSYLDTTKAPKHGFENNDIAHFITDVPEHGQTLITMINQADDVTLATLFQACRPAALHGCLYLPAYQVA